MCRLEHKECPKGKRERESTLYHCHFPRVNGSIDPPLLQCPLHLLFVIMFIIIIVSECSAAPLIPVVCI